MDIDEKSVYEFKRCHNKYDIQNYKLYGPSNPHRDGTKCNGSSDGICYMLTCDCHLNENEKILKQKCDKCEDELKTVKDCWRFPYWDGGFIGCYCKYHFKRESEEGSEMKLLCDIIELIRENNPVIDFNDNEI